MAKILIVEDDSLIQRLYQKAFTFDKHEVEVASNGIEGLNKVQSWQPTLILLDVMMPQMNGLELLEKLKSDESTKKIPVIMLTNLAGKNDAEAALAIGAVKYIIKGDHDPKEIVTMVNEILTAYTRSEIPKTVGS